MMSAFLALYIMCENFPEKFTGLIIKIGCVLGGFSMDENHAMIDEYRIISNSPTGRSDDKSLTSIGQIRHPSSHFADNNYFFNVINTIKDIANGQFQWDQSKLVLRWPNPSYSLKSFAFRVVPQRREWGNKPLRGICLWRSSAFPHGCPSA